MDQKNVESEMDNVNKLSAEINVEEEEQDPSQGTEEEQEGTFSDVTENTEEENAEDDEPIEEELLRYFIENNGKELLLFVKNKECPLSQEVLSILQEYFDSRTNIEVIDVEGITTIAGKFSEALHQETGSIPPVLYHRKKYTANYSDIVLAHDFGRLDLVLDPPRCDCYHIVIIGSGAGAQSAINELEKIIKGFNIEEIGKQLKVALVDWTFPTVNSAHFRVAGIGPQKKTSRHLLWTAIGEVQTTSSGVYKRNSGEDANDIDETCDHTEFMMDEHVSMSNKRFRNKLLTNNIDYFKGSVVFTGTDTIEIIPSRNINLENSSTSSDEDSNDTLVGKTLVGMNFVLCGGTLPRISQFTGFEHCVTIEQFMYMEEFPSSTLIIGNTPEVFETAYLLATYGAEVTVMNKYTQWLPNMDEECVEKVMNSLNHLGITFLKISKVSYVKEMRTGYKVKVTLENRKHCTKMFHLVIVDHRRVPISSIINIEIADVALDHKTKKIVVDREYRTTNTAIWAFGGVAKGHRDTPQFETLAGRRVIRDMGASNQDYHSALIKKILHETDSVEIPKFFPRILMTPLEYAYIGETEKSAKLKYKFCADVYESEIYRIPFCSDTSEPEFSMKIPYSSFTSSDPEFIIKLICVLQCYRGEKRERVVGIHFLGKKSCTLINTFSNPLEKGLTKDEFQKKVTINRSLEMGLYQTEFKLKEYPEKKLFSVDRKSRKTDVLLRSTIAYNPLETNLPEEYDPCDDISFTDSKLNDSIDFNILETGSSQKAEYGNSDDISRIVSTSKISSAIMKPTAETTFAYNSLDHEAISYSNEAIHYTPEAIPYTIEAVPYTTETISCTTEAIPSTTEAISFTTEAIPSTTEAIPYTTEAIPSTSKAIFYTTEAIPYSTEAVPYSTKSVPYSTKSDTYTTEPGNSESEGTSDYDSDTSRGQPRMPSDSQVEPDFTFLNRVETTFRWFALPFFMAIAAGNTDNDNASSQAADQNHDEEHSNEAGMDVSTNSTSEDTEEDDRDLPFPVLRINHFIHD